MFIDFVYCLRTQQHLSSIKISCCCRWWWTLWWIAMISLLTNTKTQPACSGTVSLKEGLYFWVIASCAVMLHNSTTLLLFYGVVNVQVTTWPLEYFCTRWIVYLMSFEGKHNWTVHLHFVLWANQQVLIMKGDAPPDGYSYYGNRQIFQIRWTIVLIHSTLQGLCANHASSGNPTFVKSQRALVLRLS